ncbi:MAG: MogA/MoaB family molybdenum cofactor biosynthesis protein [Dehalococcoidia bacterium]|nr:MogA/MoaB family molybdenum cofactor biosynthesis protein [Dehalococcoidia bacterium]
MSVQFRVGVVIISDKGSQGQREDRSGPEIVRLVTEAGGRVVSTKVIPDERNLITGLLLALADSGEVDLVLTTGGTGFSPRDVTPEATRAVLEREAPGIAEALRAASMRETPMSMLSRGVAGLRKRTLIVNLPGSPKAVIECLEVLLPVIPHAVETLQASVEQHPTGSLS